MTSRTTSGSGRPSTSFKLTMNNNNNNNNDSDAESISDIVNDASHLTIGPALQGNPLKSLLARKRQLANNNNETNRSTTNSSDMDSALNVESSRGPSYANSLQLIHKTEKSAPQIDNRELRDEVLSWKREHAKRLEERKKYFEPQILKIDDNYVEEPPSDNDELVEVYEESEYRSRSDDPRRSAKSSTAMTKTTTTRRSKSRVKEETDSDFKKTFGNEMMRPDESTTTTTTTTERRKLRPLVTNKSQRKFDEDEQYSINPSPPPNETKTKRDLSAASSRVTTGDTGYGSNLDLSLSSSLSMSRSETAKSKNVYQPKIYSNLTSPTSSFASSATSFAKSTSPPNLTTKPILKQLKNSLMPLPGIKTPNMT